MKIEVPVRPLTDVLHKQLNRVIAMRGEDYVFMDDKSTVSAVDVAAAIAEQDVMQKDEIRIAYSKAVQAHIDETAMLFNFDNINSIGKYVGYANSRRVIAEALGVWVDSVWTYCSSELDKINAGTISIPTTDDFIAALPIFTAP